MDMQTEKFKVKTENKTENKTVDGKRDETFKMAGCEDTWALTMKNRNKQVKITNGNGKNTITAVHWNMGSRFWRRKKEDIDNFINDYPADIISISEANIFNDVLDHEKQIQGYETIEPITMQTLGYCRLIVLVKSGVQVTVLSQFMESDAATVWLKINKKRK